MKVSLADSTERALTGKLIKQGRIALFLLVILKSELEDDSYKRT